VTINNKQHAAIWTGQTAASFVNVGPPFPTNSQFNATNGTQQVGHVTGSSHLMPPGEEPPDVYPAVCNGTADSWHLLPLPRGFIYGRAYGIDQDGNIVGYAGTDIYGSTRVALLWRPHRLAGDVNFDGKVDFQDLIVLARNYGRSNPQFGWVDGDLNGDGSVGFDDLAILARNYGTGVLSAGQLAQFDPAFRADAQRAFDEIPEPDALALLSLAGCALLFRRRRRSHAP